MMIWDNLLKRLYFATSSNRIFWEYLPGKIYPDCSQHHLYTTYLDKGFTVTLKKYVMYMGHVTVNIIVSFGTRVLYNVELCNQEENIKAKKYKPFNDLISMIESKINNQEEYNDVIFNSLMSSL